MQSSFLDLLIFLFLLPASWGQSFQYDPQSENCLHQETRKSGYNPRAPTECSLAKRPKWYAKNMSHYKLTGSQVEYGDLRYAILVGSQMESCRFQQSLFSKANLFSSKLNRSSFIGSAFDNANLSLVFAKDADFSGVKAPGARFDGANLENAKFVGADLWEASFEGANLSGADFSHAMILMTKFRGALFSDKTILPFSTDEALKKGMRRR